MSQQYNETHYYTLRHLSIAYDVPQSLLVAYKVHLMLTNYSLHPKMPLFGKKEATKRKKEILHLIATRTPFTIDDSVFHLTNVTWHKDRPN